MSLLSRNVFNNTRLLFLALLFVWTASLTSQTANTRGNDFYISLMPNASFTNDNQVFVYLTAQSATNVSLEVINQGFSESIFMTANSSWVVNIPSQFFPSQTVTNEQLGIYINSEEEVGVYVLNSATATSDGTMVLPFNALGDEYMINSYQVAPPLTSATANQFVVQATEDATLVDITFAADIVGTGNTILYNRGQTIQFEFERGQQRIFFSQNDLSGTLIKAVPKEGVACNRLAVFAGHVASLVGDEGVQGPDHLYNQMYPIADWGQEYVAIPYATRFAGDPVKVLAAENGTVVTIDGGVTVNLGRGESTIFDINEATYIESNRPISVLQLTKGRNVDNAIRGDDNADPFMVALSPSNQVIKDLTFVMPSNSRIEDHYVQIVTASADLQVSFDGLDITDRFSPVPGNPAYSHATFTVNPGLHNLSSPNGLVAHGYAFGLAESFAYALGGDLGDFDVRIFDEQLGEVTGAGTTVTICEASELTLMVDSDIPVLKDTYTVFEWDMGDGTVLFGEEVTHHYIEEGTFEVLMTASKAGNRCSSLEVSRTIIITPDGVEGIDGPTSVCPDVQDIRYQVTGNLAGYTYQWFVDGGTIDGSDRGLDVTIDWSIVNPGARVRVVARSPSGCLSDTVNLPIVLNEFLEPAIPRGLVEFCADDITGAMYTTPEATGSVYTWQVEGGLITTGQGTNTVEVNWDGPGLHRIWYSESTTTTTSLCDGISPPLEVIVYEPLAGIEENTPVSCFGETDGTSSWVISGGLAPYTYSWSNTAQTPSRTSLGAGTYTLTVTDNLGCQLVETVTIAQPDMLEGTVQVQDAVCNGERGFAIVEVMGGTAPYRYEWNTGVNSVVNRLDGLSEGVYSVRVLDANDCDITLPFNVTEPPALEAVFTSEPACPGIPDGSLSLSVTGGTAPYSFFWDLRPSETSGLLTELNDGSYRVTVTDDAGCNLELTGTVPNERPAIRFPTAFSPNGDGSNDTFTAVFNCAFNLRMVVYNRWGTAVFSSSDITQGWDGMYNGKEAPAGSYTYDITYNGVINGNSFSETVRGYVRLLR